MPNAGIEVWYRKQLTGAVGEMHHSVLYWLTASYKASGALAMDASPAVFLREAVRKLARRWQRYFDETAKKLAARFVGNVLNNGDATLGNALEQAGFTVPFKMTEAMNNALQATITGNIGLIRSIPEQYLRQVETLVMASVSRGRDLKTLTDALQQRYSVTRRRAALIARDQNNKATSALQAARQQSLGITEGIWRHSHAGKTFRKSHVRASGQRFKLNKGMFLEGKWIMPGEEINCKCGWEPVIPGLEEK